MLVWVVYGTQIAWLGLDDVRLATGASGSLPEVSYWLFSAGLILVWMWSLGLVDSRTDRVIGTGNSEYVRVARASFNVFGFTAIAAFLLQVEIARGYLILSLPIGIVMLVLVRWLWRQWLVSKRLRGEYSASVLLVGSPDSVAQIYRELGRHLGAGYKVVGACVPSGQRGTWIDGTHVPVMGSVEDIPSAMTDTGADTVAVTSIGDMPPHKVKEISWSLEAGRQHLVLAPSITDIAGPRIQTRPVAGLPLIHVETPRFTSGQRVVKRLMDVLGASVGIVLVSPALLLLAALIRMSSPGPILFRQTRVGLHGQEFEMLKFRSMVTDAEKLLRDLRQEQDAGNEVMFKMTNDPRVTRIGRVMRRFSLDELPQLFNVITGSMSLVGPRPPLPEEVARYADHVHRRFLVKPGITGLWQVSGRSSLSWEDTVRLDLSYVENWTMLTDLTIIARTARAALLPGKTAM
ncbi:sugar transferase [Microbacterium paludicola]|uniref:sugar transferase n=1 Tax=Microbacterium paludicola TaxID=300019 RepID=UPI0021B64B0D|nr:sugar transferase [Microbacterium paludicola]